MDSPRDDRTALLVAMSRALHQAGQASDGLEDIVHDLAIAMSINVQINALPTLLTIAIGPPHQQQTVMLRLEPGSLNLRKLALLDSVVREILAGGNPGEALLRVTTIDAAVPPDPPYWTVLTYGILSCGTALLLGGGRGEMLVSTLVGFAIGAIAAGAARSRRIDRVFEITAAFVATVLIGVWERYASVPISLYVALIASLVTLLPGYTLTTALSELANRNLVSGTARLGGVMVTLLSLASGFALGAGLSGNAVTNAPTASPGDTGWISSLGAAVLMAIAIASLLHARYRDLGWIIASCIGTIALARVLPGLGITEATPFATAFAVGVATNIAPRLLRVPAPVVLVPALLVLVPGSLSYESLLYVFQDDSTDGISLAVRALLAAILIVGGFLTSQLVAPRSTYKVA